MPNWCNTTYWFDGPAGEINRLHDLMQQWLSMTNEENCFGSTWLGNIARRAGIRMRNGEPHNSQGCDVDGWVECITLEATTMLSLVVNTAWNPRNRLWNELLKRYAPHTTYVFYAEEPQLAMCESNDIESRYVASYVVYIDSRNDCVFPKQYEDLPGDVDDGRYFLTERDVIDVLERHDIPQALNEIEEFNQQLILSNKRPGLRVHLIVKKASFPEYNT